MLNKHSQKKLVIVGVGFPDVLNIIENINKKKQSIKLLGFLDDNRKFLRKSFWGHKVIGGIDWLKNKKNIYVVNSVAKNCQTRTEVFKKIEKYNKNFFNLIDPSVGVSNVQFSKGVIVNKGVSFGYNTKVGFGSILSWDSHLGHGSLLGKNCFLAKGAAVLGNVKIGDKVFVGSNASVLPGVKIGSDCNIFSNSTVIENLKNKSFIK